MTARSAPVSGPARLTEMLPTQTSPSQSMPALKARLATALWLGGLVAITGLAMPVQSALAQSARLTFPPTSDCDFLGGDAQKRCEARRAGAASEVAKVRSGEIKSVPAPLSSSGGTFQPLSNPGSLGGIGESSTIAPTEDVPARSEPYNSNSIGNPWAGTPYDNGTGMPPR